MEPRIQYILTVILEHFNTDTFIQFFVWFLLALTVLKVAGLLAHQ
jgi:hypothetical protein